MLDARNRDSVKRQLIEALGSQSVLWAKADLLPYSKDTYRASFEDENKYMPDFVVLPETTAHVQSVVRIASEHRVPMIPKGGGSNRTGMLVPITGGIVIDTIRMNRVLEVDVANLHVTVQPGITLKELDEHLAAHNLWLTQEQGSYKVATIGGAISTSGLSRRTTKYGN